MESYIRVIETILLCLTIHLTQIVTALNQGELLCCIKMDEYCSVEEPLDDFDENQVNNGHQPSPILLRRWMLLTIDDCVKAEILKWTFNPEAYPDLGFQGDVLNYRNEVISQMVYDEFRLPEQFCREQGFRYVNEVTNCYEILMQEFGDLMADDLGENLFTIHTNAHQSTTIGEYNENSLQAIYLREIASKTKVYNVNRTESPFQYCRNKNQDNQSSYTVDSPVFSESTSIST